MPDTTSAAPQGSGADLARQALAAARAAAKTAPTGPARNTRPRSQRAARGHGRDPVAFGALLGTVSAEQGWPQALEGGNVLARWPELCPQFKDTVQPAGYDPDTRVLELRPSTHTIASGLRLLGGQLAKQINDKVGSPVVRAIRVLPVGRLGTPTGEPETAPTEPQAPIRTRETASPGYRAALNAALAHRDDRDPSNPYLADALARQHRAITRPANREPVEAFTAAVDDLERAAAGPDRSEAVRRAAIARKRQDQAGREPRTAFGPA